MKKIYYIVSVGITLPGLHSWPMAYLEQMVYGLDSAVKCIKRWNKHDKMFGDALKEYTITSDMSVARNLIIKTNVLYYKNLNQWRHEVFKEALLAEKQIMEVVSKEVDKTFEQKTQNIVSKCGKLIGTSI